MAQLRIESAVKSYGSVQVLHGIDLEVASGTFSVFVGPSGCGKSTLLRIVAGLEDITAGHILIDNRVVNDLPPHRRDIAMVFQNYALYPHMTVYDNIAYSMKTARMPKSEIDRRVRQAATTLRIEPYLERRPSALSGGQRQRVAIGRAITRNPKVFLLDEPLSNLDAELRVSMRLEIARLHREIGTTMVLVTHDQVEAMTLADQIVVMNDGRIEQIGTPEDVYRRPTTQFVAGFMGSPRMNFVPGRVVAQGENHAVQLRSGAMVETVNGSLLSAVGGQKLTLGIRPEAVRVVESNVTETIATRVMHHEYMGGANYIYLDAREFGPHGGGHVVAVVPPDKRPRPGEVVRIAFDPSGLHVFDETGRALV